jgi:hypothetical protein
LPEWSTNFHGYLHLTVVKGYLRKLITNDRVARYLEQYQPEMFIEFQKIAEMMSTLLGGIRRNGDPDSQARGSQEKPQNLEFLTGLVGSEKPFISYHVVKVLRSR